MGRKGKQERRKEGKYKRKISVGVLRFCLGWVLFISSNQRRSREAVVLLCRKLCVSSDEKRKKDNRKEGKAGRRLDKGYLFCFGSAMSRS